MIESDMDNTTELTFHVDNDQQNTDLPDYNANRTPLFSLPELDSLFDEEPSNNSAIKDNTGNEVIAGKKYPLVSLFIPSAYKNVNDTELYNDFDPDNALILKNLPMTKQASHQNQIMLGSKRKHSYNDDSNCEFKQKRKRHTAGYSTIDYSSDHLYRDDEANFLESVIVEEYCAKMKRSQPDMTQTAAWRLGPAKYWFDLIGVPESGDGFDYGFELGEEMEEDKSYLPDNTNEDAFLMVSQVHWEDDIIWDIDDTPEEQNLTNCKIPEWTPVKTKNNSLLHEERLKIIESESNTLYSNFPIENEELVYGLWENEIIWDAKAMKKILQPKILELDPNDENIILAVPEDLDPTLSCENTEDQLKTKTSSQKMNVKSMLSKTGVINDSDEEESTTVKPCNLNPFNISNDMYYMLKSANSLSILNHQKHMPHSIPVLQLQSQFIPTFMGPKRLRNFHRTPLKRYLRGCLSQSEPHPVLNLTKYISKKEKLRRKALEAGELFFMRKVEDLSGRDGNIVLVEFSEEYPPLINFIGMCSKIKNYFKCKPGKYSSPPKYKYGEMAYPQKGLFLGNLRPGQSLQALENNMYRVPIYEHKVSETDFLVIRTRNQYYIREINALYVAGQQCPLFEVSAPKSKKVVDFVRNFLQVFAYKTFSKSTSKPPRIHKDVLKKAFPTLKAAFLKKNLSFCADYIHNKGAPDCFHWVLKSTFRLPLEDEIRSLVSPEQCCAYFSMVAAQQRLKDAGYGDKSAFVLQDSDLNNEEMQNQLDDEVKAAPWNTTRAYIDAMNGKCFLQLTGPTDPTGCGEGFSYVRMSLKSMFKQEEIELKPKKITGTEADLRYLSAKVAEMILRNYGVPAQDIKKLTRWELIDAVRTLSTIREDRGEEGFAKFSRSKRFSTAGIQQRYHEECQRIFDRQNQVLSSNEIFSSDDEDECPNEGIEDVEKMAETIESLLNSKRKSGSLLEFEREEREREELLKMLTGDALEKEKPIELKKENAKINLTIPTLKIQRTFRNADGSEYTRTEVVRDSVVIDAYLKIRSTKDNAFIKKYAYEDEEVERQKKAIEAQLKNINVREKRKKKLSSEPAGEKDKCGNSVGQTEKCSIFPKNSGKKDQKDVNGQEFVKVNGTKLTFAMKLINDAEKTSVQSTSKGKVLPKKRKQSPDTERFDYSKQYQRPVGTNCHRTDPIVLLSTIFEEILTVIRGQKEFQPFVFPVNTKALPEYRRIIRRPMDLQTMCDNVHQKKYQSRRKFLGDIIQIKENSVQYNGQKSYLTDTAQKMLNTCVTLLTQKEDKILRLENAIKPPVDDNDQKAFSDMIGEVVKEIKAMPEAVPFLKPVNKNLLSSKDYYNIVKNPMDLETITKKIATHKYRNRAEVIEDFRLIHSNCILYNGKSSVMKNKTGMLLKTAEKHFDDLSNQILHLEISIASVQEKAMRQADIDTSWMYEVVDSADVESKKSPVNLSEDKFEEYIMDTDCNGPTANIRFGVKSQVTSMVTLNLSDDDSEDSNAGTNYIKNNTPSTSLSTIHKKSVLEEDLQCSSDDDQ